MSTKKIGYALAIIGGLGIFVSVIIDYVGFGKGGIQAAQILGILAGVIVAALGLSVAFQVPEKQIDIGGSFKGGVERLLDLPISVWFVIGFLIVYVWLFIFPVFLNTDRTMVYFNRFLPNANPIGADMNYTLDYVKTWVTTRESPYPESHYPPLTYVLLSPFTLFEYPAVYFVSTALTLFSYVILTLLLPTLFTSKKDVSLILLLSVTGLFSYGFQFELERAQYYTMAFLLCTLAIYMFHRHDEFRYLAYLLFSFSVHLKIVPIFFLPMFIKDWRDWKGNIKRMAGLGLLNVALLFVLGFRNFINFVNSLLLRVENPTFLWNGNHSVGNFVFNFVKDGYGVISENSILFLQQNAKSFERFLLALIALCVVSIILHIYRNGKTGFNPYLLLVCALCALILPVSVDYTLPMLVAPLAIFLSSLPGLGGSVGKKIVSKLLVLIASISYASLLYPFKYKPYFLNNSFPALFLLLIAVTLFYFLQGGYSMQGQKLDRSD
ncbi:MAG: DUF2029 domain-containing protein [Anaerolineales bacterium]|nr:DUF2029 domain-containing protein [Anaerolineales bacterium]